MRRRSLESGVWIWELGPRGVKSKFTDLLIFFKISIAIYQSVNQSVNFLLIVAKISIGIYQSVNFCIGNLAGAGAGFWIWELGPRGIALISKGNVSI